MALLQIDQPLYLPEGSVRSIIALALVGSFIAGLIDIELAGIAVGFYFGSKQNGS